MLTGLLEDTRRRKLRLAVFLVVAAFFPAINAEALPASKPADRVLVEKSARRLMLLQAGKVVRTYRIALGAQPVGHKECRGDNRTPEGFYRITEHIRNSQYHRSLRISYPNRSDRAAAKKRGCSPGGDIMIHGLPNGQESIGGLHVEQDWTQGCIAVTNQEIEEIWRLVPNGTPIEIKP